ncbi:hypothetical protein HBI56_184230 [Parastagonospora nodorum]|nr:hypothetical protein HBH56_192700 [Parastagonospora nodorum]KAH3937837.1 hypothetical protein HBH54_009260 [Parastagonospora nodorum]KAH3966502.1 hypothetical protein HBH52_198220 [Parastagonospora nodorum]KAH3977870.1 hypothetical protein HBH51_071050 [Parastagonospora nodorum]KAH3994117.1 hypothetical protein HBI10_190260 [Parastagonospora nodorum]
MNLKKKNLYVGDNNDLLRLQAYALMSSPRMQLFCHLLTCARRSVWQSALISHIGPILSGAPQVLSPDYGRGSHSQFEPRSFKEHTTQEMWLCSLDMSVSFSEHLLAVVLTAVLRNILFCALRAHWLTRINLCVRQSSVHLSPTLLLVLSQ